jgi:DNA processing protein
MNHYATRHASEMSGQNRHSYSPPDAMTETTIRALLDSSARPVLEPKQLDLLDGKAKASKRSPLFLAGDPSLTTKRCIAIIGARKASEIGRQRARQLGRQLAERGIVVVSGLAEGIDTAALAGAMEAGGRVIAVIGTPLDQAYPAKNRPLQEAIYREHLLVSQFENGTRVFPSNFPARNRTMAALSDASVVIEASDTSGTLHQAAECVRLNRWLGISQSVVNDPNLTWPKSFLEYPKCVTLSSTDQLLGAVYGK